jgi:hypothetical protein
MSVQNVLNSKNIEKNSKGYNYTYLVLVTLTLVKFKRQGVDIMGTAWDKSCPMWLVADYIRVTIGQSNGPIGDGP